MKHFVLLGVLTLSLLSVLSPVVADVIYYTEEATQSIMCCNMDGSDPHLVLAPGQVPCGLRVDAATEQMYWTEPYVGQIWAANLNGTGAHMVLSNVNSIADLTLDVATGQIYTAQWSTGLILQGPMAGGTAATVLSTGGSPYGIEYDSGTNKVYWADWYYLHNWVRSANTDGSGATTVATGITGADADGVGRLGIHRRRERQCDLPLPPGWHRFHDLCVRRQSVGNGRRRREPVLGLAERTFEYRERRQHPVRLAQRRAGPDAPDRLGPAVGHCRRGHPRADDDAPAAGGRGLGRAKAGVQEDADSLTR